MTRSLDTVRRFSRTQERYRREIRDALVMRRASLIAGAGVSIAATGNKDLGWRGMLEHGLNYLHDVIPDFRDQYPKIKRLLDSEPAHDDMLFIGGKLRRFLSGHAFEDWLRAYLSGFQVRHPEILEVLRRAHAYGGLIATTNYDGFLADHLCLEQATWGEGELVNIALEGGAVLHLHGHAREPDSVVLDGRSFWELQSNHHAQFVQRLLARPRVPILVGFGAGLHDSNVGGFLEWTTQVLSTQRRVYILAPTNRADIMRKQFSVNQGFCILEYGTHDELPQLLASLIPDVPPTRGRHVHQVIVMGRGRTYAQAPVQAPVFLTAESAETRIHAVRTVSSFADGSAVRNPLQPFRTRTSGQAIKGLTKRPLTTPDVQGSFLCLSSHRHFLEQLDDGKSYIFRADEKTGKSSFLGFLAARFAERTDHSFEPLWVEDFEDHDDVVGVLEAAIATVARDQPECTPVFFVDEAYRQPSVVSAIRTLLESSDPPVAQFFLTDLRLEPDDADRARRWRESRAAIRDLEATFEVVPAVPSHPVVADAEGRLTQDGTAILDSVEEAVGPAQRELLQALFLQHRNAVPLYWVASFVAENGRHAPLEQVREWLVQRRDAMAPSRLFRLTWAGPEVQQDVIRAVAYLEYATRDLLIDFVSRLRGEPHASVAAVVDRLIEVCDLFPHVDRMPYSGEDLECLGVVDGLSALALDVAEHTRLRLRDALVNCIDVRLEHAELAALLAVGKARDDTEAFEGLARKLRVVDPPDMGSVTLWAASSVALHRLDDGWLDRLVTEMLTRDLVRTTRAWVRRLDETTRRLTYREHSIAKRIQELLEVEVSRTGNATEEARLLVAVLQHRGDWKEMEAFARQVLAEDPDREWACHALASALARKEGPASELASDVAPTKTWLDAWGQELRTRCRWEEALQVWEQVDEALPEMADRARGMRVRCMLRLGRLEEARQLYTVEDAPSGARIAAAEHHMEQLDHDAAMELLQVALEGTEGSARRVVLSYLATCMGKLGRADELTSLLGPTDAVDPADVGAVAEGLTKGEAWSHALHWHERAGALKEEWASQSCRQQITCLLKQSDIERARSLAQGWTGELQATESWTTHLWEGEHYDELLDFLAHSAVRAPDIEHQTHRLRVLSLLQLRRYEEGWQALSDVAPSFETYRQAASVLKGQASDEAHRWEARVHELVGKTFPSIVEGANTWAVGAWADASMPQEVRRIADLRWSPAVLEAMAGKLVEQGSWDLAAALFERAARAGQGDAPQSRWLKTAVAWTRAEQPGRCRALLVEVPSAAPAILVGLASGLADQGKWAEVHAEATRALEHEETDDKMREMATQLLGLAAVHRGSSDAFLTLTTRRNLADLGGLVVARALEARQDWFEAANQHLANARELGGEEQGVARWEAYRCLRRADRPAEAAILLERLPEYTAKIAMQEEALGHHGEAVRLATVAGEQAQPSLEDLFLVHDVLVANRAWSVIHRTGLLGRVQEAAARQAASGTPDALRCLARVRAMQGDFALAIADGMELRRLVKPGTEQARAAELIVLASALEGVMERFEVGLSWCLQTSAPPADWIALRRIVEGLAECHERVLSDTVLAGLDQIGATAREHHTPWA